MILSQLNESDFSELSSEKEEASDQDVCVVLVRAMTHSLTVPMKNRKKA